MEHDAHRRGTGAVKTSKGEGGGRRGQLTTLKLLPAVLESKVPVVQIGRFPEMINPLRRVSTHKEPEISIAEYA